jgi:hypothetical protein
MIQQQPRYGRLHLDKISEEGHRAAKKKGQKGKNAIFVMTHDEIMHTLRAEIKSLMQIQLLITAHRQTTPTAFESQWGVI